MAKVALLIGVSEYESGLTKLLGAVKDVEAMQRVLQHPEMGDFAEVNSLLNPEPVAMQEAIETLFSGRTKNDLLLLFFSGHGIKDESGKLYFATRITRKNKQGELIKATAVPASFVQDAMSHSRSKRQIVILDCCFSGAFAEGLLAKEDSSVDIKNQLGGEGRAILTSSTSTQYSFEQQKADLSIYTRYLVEGMETGAADQYNDGTISVEDLHEYAKKKVQETAPVMQPEIYAVREGFKIILAKAPIGDVKLKYRRQVERYASQGEISMIGRNILEVLGHNLGLLPEEIAAIEAEVLKPYQEYKIKLQQYERALVDAIGREQSLSEHTRYELQCYQEILGLRDADIAPIEAKIISGKDSIPSNQDRPSTQLISVEPRDVTANHQTISTSIEPEVVKDNQDASIQASQPIVTNRFSIISIISNRRLQTLLLASVLVTSLVMGVRYLGILQTSDLNAYDHLMQLRPKDEKPDSRLLIVTIDEADIQYQNQQKMNMRGSLSDQALAQLLQKLDQFQPQAIGIDIYHDFAVDSKYLNLAQRFQQDNRLFTVCKVSVAEDGRSDGISPPPKVPKERQGFSDFVDDEDGILRRQLLNFLLPVSSPCPAKYAFSLKLANHYLNTQGSKAEINREGNLQFGKVVFQQLKPHTSGYQKEDVAGYQVLLNYRSLPSLQDIAVNISLRQILNDQVNPEIMKSQMKNRIVLIGVTASNSSDYWQTPYSAIAPNSEQQIPGVYIHAHMVSQILSAVLDGRPLFWWWTGWVEALWMWGWSLLGGIIALWIRQPLYLVLAVAIASLTLFGTCLGVFIQAGWIPLIPSALALLATAVVLKILPSFRMNNRKNSLGT